jgi:hypothetical protein
MVKKVVKSDCKPSIPFSSEKEKENEQGDKIVALKLQHADDGSTIPNPTTEFSPLFYPGTVEHLFKWVLALLSIMQGHTIQ